MMPLVDLTRHVNLMSHVNLPQTANDFVYSLEKCSFLLLFQFYQVFRNYCLTKRIELREGDQHDLEKSLLKMPRVIGEPAEELRGEATDSVSSILTSY